MCVGGGEGGGASIYLKTDRFHCAALATITELHPGKTVTLIFFLLTLYIKYHQNNYSLYIRVCFLKVSISSYVVISPEPPLNNYFGCDVRIDNLNENNNYYLTWL